MRCFLCLETPPTIRLCGTTLLITPIHVSKYREYSLSFVKEYQYVFVCIASLAAYCSLPSNWVENCRSHHFAYRLVPFETIIVCYLRMWRTEKLPKPLKHWKINKIKSTCVIFWTFYEHIAQYGYEQLTIVIVLSLITS